MKLKKCFIWQVIALALILILYNDASAIRQVTLQWDPNTESNLAGYRIFMREELQNYDYSMPVWETVETECIIYDLSDDKTYYFVARAFDTNDFESADSNEVMLEAIPVVLPPEEPLPEDPPTDNILPNGKIKNPKSKK